VIVGCREEFKENKKKTKGRRNNNRVKRTAGRVIVKVHSSIEERGDKRGLEKKKTHREAGKRDSFQFRFTISQTRYM